MKAVELRPEHYWATMEIGYLHIRKGDRARALEYFLKAKNIAPKEHPDHCQKFIRLASRESRLATSKP